MKVSDEHYAELEAAIKPLDTEERRRLYLAGDFPRADAVKDLDKRYRWDLLWAAVRAGHSLPDSTCGYSDAHLDTALRKLVAPLWMHEPKVAPATLVTAGNPQDGAGPIDNSAEAVEVRREMFKGFGWSVS